MNPLLRKAAHRVYKKLETATHPLSYLFLEITRKCNLNCLHCGSDCGKEARSSELRKEDWFRIIDSVAEKFGKHVFIVITGGEPLVHPNLIEIGRRVAMVGMRWGMVTNGMMITEKRLDELLDAGLCSITVSLDGTVESHTKLRGSVSSYHNAVKALKFIGKSGLESADVVTCVYPGNLTHLDSVAETLIENGIKQWRIFRIFPNGRASGNPDLSLSFEETWSVLNWIRTNRLRYKMRGLDVSASCEGYLHFEDDIAVRSSPFFCRSGINIAAILADGTITGCSNNHCSLYQGNILEDDLLWVWENEFKDYRERKWLQDSRCQSCKELAHCRGGSMHHWNIEEKSPAFCYIHDLERPDSANVNLQPCESISKKAW